MPVQCLLGLTQATNLAGDYDCSRTLTGYLYGNIDKKRKMLLKFLHKKYII
ncbi:hypothetical protein CLOSTMETH_03740 [[Clostridium] methylpentosum DSM 5476]|uniref:Uncharacterized protein n=1 Tax=[Clostridium] methylpentosum DSM 5476 TaxID=537013 RepID=C0EIP5_9FIRM|nr:hypothetical protein CLOSTMETH_03740 [[Clostridium] methylpentosum DSM 5476]